MNDAQSSAKHEWHTTRSTIGMYKLDNGWRIDDTAIALAKTASSCGDWLLSYNEVPGKNAKTHFISTGAARAKTCTYAGDVSGKLDGIVELADVAL